MSISVDLYIHAESALHRLDPRVKLLGVLLGTVVVFMLPGPLALLASLGLLIALLRANGVPAERVRWVLRSLLPLTVLIMVIQPWFVIGGRELAALGPLRLTTDGLAAGLRLAIRANVLALLALLPLLTTRQDDLVRGLVQLGLPYSAGLTITLALRFIPVAAGLFLTIKHAQEARGLDLDRGNILRRVRVYIPVLTALVIQSIRLSDHLAMAMAVRGLNHGPRTERHTLVMRRADWLAAAGLLAGFVAALVLVQMGP